MKEYVFRIMFEEGEVITYERVDAENIREARKAFHERMKARVETFPAGVGRAWCLLGVYREV